MSHIHLPDGVLPPVIWIPGFIICFALLYLLAKRVKRDEVRKKMPFAGVIGALMLIFMSVPLGIIPVHLSLTVLCGILAGPGLGFIAVFAVNTILALIGHGGFTVIGVNTLLMGSEIILGFYIFRLLSQKAGKTISAVLANIVALLVSTSLMITIIGSAAGLTNALPLIGHDEEHAAEVQEPDNGEVDRQQGEEPDQEVRYLFFTGWTAVAAILLVGIIIESLVTGLIVRFFAKVRPDLLDAATHV
ncbi:MAG TPA: energy-coupling factor ABC transporter permease [Clostridiales bacterium]|nr:energy-coupling factor ABC transporter permease [Clostridiales bacterium]